MTALNNFIVTDPKNPYINLGKEFKVSISKSAFSRGQRDLNKAYKTDEEKVKKRNINYKYISLFETFFNAY